MQFIHRMAALEYIWQIKQLHSGFQETGAHLLDCSDMHLETDERPEDLYQRLMTFVEDNLFINNGVPHHGEATEENEELFPTLEKFIVFT